MAGNGVKQERSLTIDLDEAIDRRWLTEHVARNLERDGALDKLALMAGRQAVDIVQEFYIPQGVNLAHSLDSGFIVAEVEETLQDESFWRNADLDKVLELLSLVALHKQGIDVAAHFDVPIFLGKLMALYSRYDNLQFANDGYRITDIVTALEEGQMDFRRAKTFTDEALFVRGRYPGLIRGSVGMVEDWIRSFYARFKEITEVYGKIGERLDVCLDAMQYASDRLADYLPIRPEASLIMSKP